MKYIYKQAIAVVAVVSPSLASRIIYLRGMRKWPNFRDPRLFSEKLMKLKLDNYLNNPTVWSCVDKLAVRDYLKDKGVSVENMPKILGVYSDANDIDFESLPQKFALKCTHGAGFNIICKDKSSLDRVATVGKLNRWLRTGFGLQTAETHYGKVEPSIICEEFIEGDGGKLPEDYKVYCFGGVPLYIMACTERVDRLSKVNIFDLEWQDTGYIKPQFASSKPTTAPKTLPAILEMAAAVSKEFPFVRVDFYEDKGRAILGEMTFTPHACVNSNMTDEGQVVLGRALVL